MQAECRQAVRLAGRAQRICRWDAAGALSDVTVAWFDGQTKSYRRRRPGSALRDFADDHAVTVYWGAVLEAACT